MLEFGLTGGIGSGKSTVSGQLAALGASIIDADAIVRDLQLPGELVFEAMVERWGSAILQVDGDNAGQLDRAAVASIVFNDEDELAALNAIVHPAVADETQRRVDELAGCDAVVVYDIPLLVWPGGEILTSRDHSAWTGIIVVDTPEELAIERVMVSRGMEREAIVARMDAQATRDERRAIADFVIDNSRDLEHLEAEVNRCWEWIQTKTRSQDESTRFTTGADTAAATRAAQIKPTGLDGPSGVESSEPAQIKPTGLDGPSGVESSEPAQIKPTGLDGPSGVESSEPAQIKPTGLDGPSGVESSEPAQIKPTGLDGPSGVENEARP